MAAIELWNGRVIGPGVSHFHNSSKGFQLTTTIRNAIQTCKDHALKFPKSFFIKGKKNYHKMIKENCHLVVKSCSGIRSEVASFEIFKHWNLDSLTHLPTIFQSSCVGPDIRIHWMGDFCWSVILYQKKGSIDYRYAKERGSFEKLEEPSLLSNFCELLAKTENLRLIGVDFVKVDNNYYCLESNPNPGWAGFHRFCGDEPNLALELIRQLEN